MNLAPNTSVCCSDEVSEVLESPWGLSEAGPLNCSGRTQEDRGLHLVMGLSSPSADDFFIMINREVPSAYDLNSAGQLEQTQKPLLPSADALLRRPSLVQADHTPGGGLAWDTLVSYLVFLEGQASVRPGGCIHGHAPLPHTRPTPTLKKKTHKASLSSFLGSTQSSRAKGLQQTFPDRLISRQLGWGGAP